MEKYPEDYLPESKKKGKELETSSDLEAEEKFKHNNIPNDNGDNELGEFSSFPNTPPTPHTRLVDDVLIISESSSSESSSSESSSSESSSKPPSVHDALAIYISDQRSELKRNSRGVIDDLMALRKGDQWTFAQDFAATGTALMQASAFLNTLGTASEDVNRAIKQLLDDAKKVSPPPTEESNKLISFEASSLMYFMTFFLGRWLTTATGCGILLSGAGGQVALAVLVNNLVVPLTQAMLGDPMGASLRNYGPNVPSEDSRQYANFMTAHALYMRSCISGIPPGKDDPVVEMDRILNEVVWREQGRPDSSNQPTTKGTWFPSGVNMVTHPKQSADTVTAALKSSPYSGCQRARVVGSMLARILVADEAPVHSFSFFNGVTGMLGNLRSTLFGVSSTGQVVSRVVDAAMHTAAGTFAMFVMFQMQDQLRPIVQSSQRVDPSDEKYLKLKQAPYAPVVLSAGNTQDCLKDVADALGRLRSELKSAQKLMPPASLEWSHFEPLLRGVKDLCKRYQQKIKELQVEMDAAQKDVQVLDSASKKLARGVLDTWRVFSGKTAKSIDKSWTDGSPSVVRAASKYLGYATALVPTTVLSIHVAQGIGNNYQAIKQQVADAQNAALANGGLLLTSNQAQARYQGSARAWAPQVPEVTASNVTLTREQIASAHNPYLTASAFNATVAIAGWNLRNVALDPLFQHIIHAGIGLAERAGSICCGYGAADHADSQQTIDLTNDSVSNHPADAKEIEDALVRIEANLKMNADELRRLRVLVMGGEPGDESTEQGNGDEHSQVLDSPSTSGSDSDSSSQSGSNTNRMD